MNYAALKTTLASYLHRDDLTAMIPTFILLAQSRMSHDLEDPSMQTTATLDVMAAMKEVVLPSDFLELMSIRIPNSGGYKTLLQRTLVGNTAVLDNGGATGSPSSYARYGNILELTPIPDSDTTLEIVYRQRIAEFTEDTDTDTLLTVSPNIYIYGAMLEAMPFLSDPSQVWQSMYIGEVSRLNEIAYTSEWSGSPLEILNLGMETP
jgi:hypothetical protein